MPLERGGGWWPLRTGKIPLEAGMSFCIAADGTKHEYILVSSMHGSCGPRGSQVNSIIILKDIELTGA